MFDKQKTSYNLRIFTKHASDDGSRFRAQEFRHRKSQEITRNHRKSQDITGNLKKSQEIGPGAWGHLRCFSRILSRLLSRGFSPCLKTCDENRWRPKNRKREKRRETSYIRVLRFERWGRSPREKKNQNAENIGKASSIHFPLKNNQLGNLHQNT